MGQDAERKRVEQWLHLHLCDQVGPTTFARLLDRFGDIGAVLAAPPGQLAAVKGIGRKTADRIAASRSEVNVEAELAQAHKLGVKINTRQCQGYPPALQKIHDPPAVLYVKGELTKADALAVAMVGSRSCSAYGQEQAARLSHLLAAAGVTIVSGLARGIDTAAHRGALSAKGRTIAVLGCGLAKVYPEENQDLADKITAAGALVSELPLNFEPLPGMFHSRNRIISGLSLGTIVVEARARSGALITARLAMEQNREVMAVPGRIDAPGSTGPHRLIRDGAQLVENIEDVMDALGQVGEILKDHAGQSADAAEQAHEAGLFQEQQAQPLPLTELENQVMACLDQDPTHIDAIVSQTNLPPGKVSATVTALQLKGLIKQLPGSYYQIRRPNP